MNITFNFFFSIKFKKGKKLQALQSSKIDQNKFNIVKSISNKFSKINFEEHIHQKLTPIASLKAKLFQFFFEVATVVVLI